jgi:hypothetical protein
LPLLPSVPMSPAPQKVHCEGGTKRVRKRHALEELRCHKAKGPDVVLQGEEICEELPQPQCTDTGHRREILGSETRIDDKQSVALGR